MTGNGTAVSFDHVIQRTECWIKKACATLRTRKARLQKVVREVLGRAAHAGPLQGCHMQVVGSTSWGGDVPQSDLDVVVLTPTGDQLGHKAVALLRELANQLCVVQGCEGWQAVELLEASKVPVLKIIDAEGLKCDITVDQHNTLWLRDHLSAALTNGRPEAQRLVRLVKLWLHSRGLPTAVEGGFSSVAWSVMAMSFADEQPDMSLSQLITAFFGTMQRLGRDSLRVSRNRSEGTRFHWTFRGGGAAAWSPEWLSMLEVEDPCSESLLDGGQGSLTPASLPTAVCLLYAAEFRLTARALMEGRYQDVWRVSTQPAGLHLLHSSPKEVARRCRMEVHAVLHSGSIRCGRLQRVTRPRGSQWWPVHRREKQCSLLLSPWSPLDDSKTPPANKAWFSCRPSHWIRSLETDSGCLTAQGMAFLSALSELYLEHVNTVSWVPRPLVAVSCCLLDACRPTDAATWAWQIGNISTAVQAAAVAATTFHPASMEAATAVASTSRNRSSASKVEASRSLADQRDAPGQVLRQVPPPVPPTAPWAQRGWLPHGVCSGRVQQQPAVCKEVPEGTDVQFAAQKIESTQEGKEPFGQTKLKRSLKIRNARLSREELKALNVASQVNSARPSSKGGAEDPADPGVSPRGEALGTSRSDESTRATDSDDESEATRDTRSIRPCAPRQAPKQQGVWPTAVNTRDARDEKARTASRQKIEGRRGEIASCSYP